MKAALPWFFLLLGAAAFAAAFPNPLELNGFGFLGWVALAPVFYFTKNSSWPFAVIGGALWSLVAYLLSTFWLSTFHPLALGIVLAVIVPEHIAVFWASWFLWRLFPQRGFWIQAILWTAFEYLRTLGFLGFPYGELASTQFTYPLLIQTADLVGIWGITFLLAWVGAFFAGWKRKDWKILRWDAGAFGLILIAACVYGGVQLFAVHNESVSETPRWNPALIQHVEDPWKGGTGAYESGLDNLISLSRQALSDSPDAVIWSETAFVPSVFYHEKYRDNPDSYRLVRKLTDFLQGQKVPFVLGNDHREKVEEEGKTLRTDYNAALTWVGGWKAVYRKIRLVPFTETFPYKDLFPGIYKALLDADTHFWEPGTEWVVADLGTVKIGTPICFEDAFGDLCRRFVLGGADVLVNLTNDSWSGSPTAMRQHFALALFRAVENRRSLLTVANDGTTAAVGPDGGILAKLPEQTRTFLRVSVPLEKKMTLYTEWGDWFALCCCVFSGAFTIVGAFLFVKRKEKLNSR